MKTILNSLFFCTLLIVNAKSLANQTPDIININFQNMPIKSALLWFAEYNDKNIVLDTDIQGNLTTNLQKISWEHALNVILKSYKLSKENIDGVLYVSKTTQEENQIKKPMQSLWIQLNYATSEEIEKLLKTQSKNLLSNDGYFIADKRTNSILIRDHENQLNEMKNFIKNFDISSPQISIETIIVNVDSECEKELGTKFGITNGNHISSSLDMHSSSNNISQFGIAKMKLNKKTLLDLELSALESEGKAEIISRPKLFTVNQKTAYIEAGEEVPYQEKASEGATSTSFKKAVLSLQVTPQIMKNNQIMLSLKINQDKRSNKEVLGVPSIDTREISTQILLKNGQTAVLGGIYEYIKIKNTEKVPFISNLPIIGVLFKHKKMTNNRRELLIFVTPKIV